MRPVVLCILDGWGWREEGEANAVRLAEPAEMEALSQRYPHLLLRSSGKAVGLPPRQMGNSEVGHLTLGAGRPVQQILTRALEDVESGGLAEDATLQAALAAAARGGGTLHVMGLLSDGGVHSHQALAEETVRIASRFRTAEGDEVDSIRIHAFLDGRDTPPESAAGYLEHLQKVLDRVGRGRVASLAGRFYAMDRDGNWDRTEKAWKALVLGEGHPAGSWREGLEAARGRGESDEFVEPTVVAPEGGDPTRGRIRSGDSVVFFNFRADRARQITRALVFDDFTEFARPERPRPARFTGFAPYHKDWNLPAVYESRTPSRTLGEVLSQAACAQYRVAETEKYAHVTYFFNGGRETPFPGEERVLIPSRKRKSYATLPEMQAEAITDAVVRTLEDAWGASPVIIMNLANADMVGHSGELEATVQACRVVDRCVGRLARSLVDRGGALLVTADHGNAEQMVDPATGGPHTAHTANPVPCILAWEDARGHRTPAEAGLQDVAPSLLDLLGLKVPEEMSGRSLLDRPGR